MKSQIFRIGKILAAAPLLGLLAGLAPAPTAAQAIPAATYTYCTFRPQAASCQAAYNSSLHDPSPAAVSVKEAFENYGRYVRAGKTPLTDDDRRYLSENNVAVPPDLNAEDLAGLHQLIRDESSQGDSRARIRAINNFIARAIQAELYCNFNSCKNLARTANQGGG